MLVIIPDTNILAASPSLASPEWQSLIQHRGDWQVQIVIPDIVLMETTNVVRKAWKAEQTKLQGLKVGEFGLGEAVQALRSEIQQHIDSYEDDLRRRIADIGAKVFPVPPVDHLEVATRASNRIPPYQGESKDGYRDTLIWLNVIAAAEEYKSADVWFVSENTKDFGPKGNDWTGPNRGSRNDCPINFHSSLIEELATRGVEERVKLVTNLQLLEQHLAALHGPISDEELARLTSTLDFGALNHILEMMPKGSKIAPYDAALNPNVTQAFLNHLTTNEAPWNFTDAAKRGEGRWTASYAVDVEVELTTFTSTGTSAVVTKDLRLSGFVNIKEPNEIEKLEMTTMSSLPNDPDRALWETSQDSFADVYGSLGALKLPPGFLDAMNFQPPAGLMETFKFEPPVVKFPQGFLDAMNFQPPAGLMETLKFEPPVVKLPPRFLDAMKFQMPPGFGTGGRLPDVGLDCKKSLDQPDQPADSEKNKDEADGVADPKARDEDPEP